MVPRGLGQTARMLYTVGVQAPLRRSERDRAVKESLWGKRRGDSCPNQTLFDHIGLLREAEGWNTNEVECVSPREM